MNIYLHFKVLYFTIKKIR